jgi:hypothetical protein
MTPLPGPKAGGTPECLEEDHLPCDALSEFEAIQVPAGTDDRLRCMEPDGLPAKSGSALRVWVQDGDQAVNAEGEPIPSGWRAEATKWTETQGDTPIRYRWSTMLVPDYPVNPKKAAGDDGNPPWQLFFQWHQAETDVGVSPPVEFIIREGQFMLSMNLPEPVAGTDIRVLGRWPLGDAVPGRWHDFQAEITWHLERGTVRVWRDNEEITFEPQVPKENPTAKPFPNKATTMLTGVKTMFPPKGGTTPSVYLKVGLYREAEATEPPGPYMLYQDEILRCVPSLRTATRWWEKLPQWLKDLIARLRR